MCVLNILLSVLCVVGCAEESYSPTNNDTTTLLRLDEVVVVGHQATERQTDHTQSTERVDNRWLVRHDAGSLSATLSRLPGVQSIQVGSAQAKPMVRGLGFTRLAVIHDGVRHEGQQWGDDHGLEIDRFGIDRIEVLKGPAALLYGSDAIGGALLLSSQTRPTKRLSGKAQVFMRTNNMLFGGSVLLEGMQDGFFWRMNATYQDYQDMHVPTDSINYYSYRIPLYHRTLRNTAGKEADGSLTLGYAGYHWHTCMKIYETYATSGFFANAHGLEVRLSKIDYDKSSRDIDLPRQSVNHLKILSHTAYHQDDLTIEANLAWQHNLRREESEPVSHGYMPTPDGTLERGFQKHTGTFNIHARYNIHDKHLLRLGLNAEIQHNRRSGWDFIIPDFEQYTAGIFASEKWSLTQELTLNAGLRYDYAHTHIRPYQDWYLTPISSTGTSVINDSVYIQRSKDLRRHFHSFTWSAGLQYLHDFWEIKANIGKGFRIPIAKEFGANGINYHIFRYEEGNPELQPEVSYQADVSIGYSGTQWQARIDPFIGYFPNYIYLNPTADYHEGLQLYRYTESQVLRTGVEASVSYSPLTWLEATLQGEYLFARQLSGDKRGYALPFSPPWRLMPEVKFLWDIEKGKRGGNKRNGEKREGEKQEGDTLAGVSTAGVSTSGVSNAGIEDCRLCEGYVSINCRITGAQNDIVPPEKPTPGWWTLNITAGQKIQLRDCIINLSLSADNILNTCYYDHTSYYRLIDIPEAGRNISVNIGVEF